jgi:hypothetical protein
MHYEVDESIGLHWLESNRLLLLLDELETVPLTQRLACIKAINQFRTDYGLSQIVISSDAKGYKMAGMKLRLENAIHVSLLPPAPTKTQESIDLGPKADSYSKDGDDTLKLTLELDGRHQKQSS